jgi:NitT/TauT family transport system substrate-binding protein
MRRRSALGAIAGAALAPAWPTALRAQSAKKLLIAEPQHGLGYLPLYVGIANGYFKGLDVSTITLTSSGGEHTDAVLTGKAWAFIGGPEHNAFADIKGANLRAVCNIVNRGNTYFVARPGLAPGGDMRAFFKGKTIVTGNYGGTPNSITRYVVGKLGLDVKSDVRLLEVATPAMPAAMSGARGDIASINEPMISKGVADGLWQQPFYNPPKLLGPYAYSTINVPLKTITDDPVTTTAFVAGMKKALAFVRDHPEGALAVAAKEFPDLTAPILKASLQRSYDDQIWEYSGMITPAAIRTAEAVVKAAGLLTQDVAYSEIVDMRYVTAKTTGER